MDFTTQQPFYFLQLPREIRNRIYEFDAGDNRQLEIQHLNPHELAADPNQNQDTDVDPTSMVGQTMLNSKSGLAYTCLQVWQEYRHEIGFWVRKEKKEIVHTFSLGAVDGAGRLIIPYGYIDTNTAPQARRVKLHIDLEEMESNLEMVFHTRNGKDVPVNASRGMSFVSLYARAAADLRIGRAQNSLNHYIETKNEIAYRFAKAIKPLATLQSIQHLEVHVEVRGGDIEHEVIAMDAFLTASDKLCERKSWNGYKTLVELELFVNDERRSVIRRLSKKDVQGVRGLRSYSVGIENARMLVLECALWDRIPIGAQAMEESEKIVAQAREKRKLARDMEMLEL